MFYIDTETCGLHGIVVLIQYAKDDGEIVIFEPWRNPIIDTLKLIDDFCAEGVIGFNLTFDWFHLTKLYCLFSMFKDPYIVPEDAIEAIAANEKKAIFGPCVKPKIAFDVFLHACRTEYQSVMNREDIKIRRVPTGIAFELADELEKRVDLDSFYFARRKNPNAKKWSVVDTKDTDFKDLVLRFKASAALKILAAHALHLNPLTTFKEIRCEVLPTELGWAPFAYGLMPWPRVVKHHIEHWAFNDLARTYARNDIIYTRGLYKFFGSPVVGDVDSTLACMVGATRWAGFAVNLTAIEILKQKAIEKSTSAPKAPTQARRYIFEKLNAVEQSIVTSTKRIVLEEMAKWDGHPVAERAKKILEARQATKEIEIYDKLLDAGRFHPSFRIIGTLSSRMSGADGLNPQGIKKAKEVRSAFTLNDTDSDTILSGGDFDAFEVVLMDACFYDPLLRIDLQSGKKIHAIFGEFFYPMSYYEIMANKEIYTRSKSGVFAIAYGGTAETLMRRLGISKERAEEGYLKFINKYQQFGKARQMVFNKFASMKQPGGLGTKVEWHDPEEFIESMFGFRRYFTLENKICKILFDLANKMPKHWQQMKAKVVRRDRQQTTFGASCSALYAAAFNIQAGNMRAAANHVIQSSGAQLTKAVQEAIWKLQPVGIAAWVVKTMNVHDEIMCVHKSEAADAVKKQVDDCIQSFRGKVPLLKMAWKIGLTSWADK